jgi:hypothetical protein
MGVGRVVWRGAAAGTVDGRVSEEAALAPGISLTDGSGMVCARYPGADGGRCAQVPNVDIIAICVQLLM